MRALYGTLDRRRRVAVALQLGLMLLSALAETATLGAVVPFLALLASAQGARFALPVLNLPLDIGSASLLFAGVAAFGMVIRIITQRQASHLAFAIGGDLADVAYRRILHQPYAWHSRRNSSEVLASLAKINAVVSDVINPLLQGAVSVLAAFGIIVALMLVDAAVAAASAGVVGLFYVLASLFVRARVLRNGRTVAQNETLRIRAMQEGLGGIRDVLLEGTQDYFATEFDRYNRRSRLAKAENDILFRLPRYFIETAGMVFIVALAWWMTSNRHGIAGAIPVLGALALGAQRMLPHLQLVYLAWSSVLGSRSQLSDVLALVHLPMPAAEEPALAASGRARDKTPLVKLIDVSFAYSPEALPVLRGVDLEITRGSRIGVIGETGCGKSTLVDILMGLLEPTQGQVLIDGEALGPANRTRWQRRIAHVPQHIYLADASIARNIAFGRDDGEVDMTRVERAARMARLDDQVASLDARYDAATGERGVRLSGGQRQRIGLARALYRQADLLVLDEATSALDDRTEADVIATIEQLGRTMTIVMIAHRLSTLRSCDVIVELVAGRIARVGPPAEILPAQMFGSDAVASLH